VLLVLGNPSPSHVDMQRESTLSLIRIGTDEGCRLVVGVQLGFDHREVRTCIYTCTRLYFCNTMYNSEEEKKNRG
jgi:hypothetical protein